MEQYKNSKGVMLAVTRKTAWQTIWQDTREAVRARLTMTVCQRNGL